MQTLLSGTNRNYLPTSSGATHQRMQGSGAYPGLTPDVRNAVNANAVLSPAQLAALSPADQQQIMAARQVAALRQAARPGGARQFERPICGHAELDRRRFGAPPIRRRILDLQARISAELGMLQNEQTKLQVLSQAGEPKRSESAAAAEREQSIAGQGRFETRFQPAP